MERGFPCFPNPPARWYGMPEDPSGTTDFHDVSSFASWTRVVGLTLSPDGGRLIATVQSPGSGGRTFVPALWEIDPTGEHEARRLTWSARGESSPAFTADGELLFLSGRDRTDPGPELWRLPEHGEARVAARHPGGIRGFTSARSTGTIAYSAGLLPGALDAESSAKLRKVRSAAGVNAILYESGATRYLGRDLGPEEPHVFVREIDRDAPVNLGGLGLGWATGADTALSPDGTRIAYTRNIDGRIPDENRAAVVVADTGTGERLHVVDGLRQLHYRPVFTADGAGLVCHRELQGTYDRPPHETLIRTDLVTGEETDLLAGFEHWPMEVSLSPVPGDDTLWFTAGEQGRSPVFRRDPDGTVTRLTESGAYSGLCVSPGGRTLYALRSGLDAPPRPVRLDAAEAGQEPAVLPSPGGIGALPGTLTEVHTEADDGFPLRGWLVLPAGACAEKRAPLLVCVHGGPHISWSAWSWQWNPWVFAARGYAVLMPDPALSTGYGRRMLERGWGQWGGRPYHDVMALTDAVVARSDIDATRTSLAGASYGGYLANRVATRTDRFKAIVSCSGQWDLRSFQSETDSPWQFQRFLGDPLTQPERYEADSPHLDVARIRTPMLVTHGGKDYRVPVTQSAALFQDLQRFEVPVKFLYFPNENHGITAPGNLALRYSAILNFLDHHVLGAQWRLPEVL